MHERIHSIDAVRGFCLLNIFINHVTLGVLPELSPSKITLCDSAEVFVLLAGLSTYLAYGPRAGSFDPGEATGRIWRRAIAVYLANLALIAASCAILYLGALGPAPPASVGTSPVELVRVEGALAFAWHAATLQQSVGFSMVLRLYVFLMIVAPFYVWLASKRFWYPLVPAAAVWLVAGHFGLASSDSLTGELLSMTVLPWQLVFALGIALGAAIAQRVALPRSPGLAVAAAAVVGGGTLLLALGPHLSPDLYSWLEARNSAFWAGISKSYQSPLRLTYLVAFGYLFLAFPRIPLIRLLHEPAPDGLLCRLGRRSLRVFAVSAVLAVAFDQLLWNLGGAGLITLQSPAAVALEIALVGIGIVALSRVADWRRARPAATVVPAPGQAVPA